MSVSVKHLNADSTFLLTFSPLANPTAADLRADHGAYTVLIDPWLVGDSIVSARWFAITKHVIPSHIQHLSEIEEPDLVVVSQNKPDHCHKQTLLQLNPEGKTIIAAEPGAAKAIRGWNHFDPNRVHGMAKYDPNQRFGNSLRLHIPPLSPQGHAGEINVSFMPAKNYMTGLHNAFGITYQAPTHTKAVANIPTVDLPSTKFLQFPPSPATMASGSPPAAMSISRPISLTQEGRPSSQGQSQGSRRRPHRPHLSRSSNTASSEFLSFPERRSMDSEQSGLNCGLQMKSMSNPLQPYLHLPSPADADPLSSMNFAHHVAPPTPPESPLRSTSASTSTTTIASMISSPYFRRRSKHRLSSRSTPDLLASLSFPLLKATASAQSEQPTSLQKLPVHPPRPKPISILYTPHGIPSQDLDPYVTNHLANLSALPLTLLFHSFDTVNNPWYLGGNISAGAQKPKSKSRPKSKSSRRSGSADLDIDPSISPSELGTKGGGVEIAQRLMARVWLSAHDEPKDDRGFAVRLTRTRRVTAAEVRRMLWTGYEGAELKRRGWTCDVRSLGVGGGVCVGANERNLVPGATGGEWDFLDAQGEEEDGVCECGLEGCGAAAPASEEWTPDSGTGEWIHANYAGGGGGAETAETVGMAC